MNRVLKLGVDVEQLDHKRAGIAVGPLQCGQDGDVGLVVATPAALMAALTFGGGIAVVSMS
nr:hypothetical protein [Pseudooceanicola spongiae]